MSLSPMPGVTTTSWRQSTICVKRGGSPAATYKDYNYWSRPHPESNSQCPAEYKKCGQGDTQASGAICFPVSSPCPITNMVVLSRKDSVPADQGWESVGVFEAYNTTLYVRREQLNELPIIDVVARLTELTPQGQNMRGQCYQGAMQTFDQPLLSDPNSLWSYSKNVPTECESADSRYQLFDSVDLQGHFLENLQLTQPSCEPFALYPTYDSLYNVTTDPDYLNSDVKCDFTTKYTCVRDPYQRTDCAPGDAICHGVVNQNICGEYAHAVRSAFTNYTHPTITDNTIPVTLGLYYAREVQWTDSCDVDRETIFAFGLRLPFVVALLLSAWLFWMVPMLCCKKDAGLYCEGNHNCHILFPLLMCTFATAFFSAAFSATVEWKDVYTGIDSGDCTDPISTDMLLHQLDPLMGQWEIMLATMVLMWFFTACIIADKLCCPVAKPENRDNDNQHPNSLSALIERYRLDFYLRGSYSTTNTTTNYPTTADYHNVPVPTTAVCSQAQHSAHTYTAEALPPPPSSKARSNTARHTRTTHNTTRYTTRNNSCNTMSEAHASASTQTVSPQQILYPHRISSDPIGRRNHYYNPQPPPPPSVSPVRSCDQSPTRPRLLSPQGSNKPPPPLSSPRAAAAASQSRIDALEETFSINNYV